MAPASNVIMSSTNEAHRDLIHSFMTVMRTTETWALFLCTKNVYQMQTLPSSRVILMVEQTKQTNL